MIMFTTEMGHTGAIYGELRTGRWANLAELNSVAGMKTDAVSALTMRFILDKALYTPMEVDESLWAVPLVSLEPAEQGSPKRLKLEESEYSAAGEQEDEHMQEWTEAVKNPGSKEEIQAQLEASFRLLAHLKDIKPEVVLSHLLQDKEVEPWFRVHLATDDGLMGTDHSTMDETEKFFRIEATANRAVVNPVARRHLDISLQEYLFGDKHDPPEREKEMLQGVRTALDYAEKDPAS